MTTRAGITVAAWVAGAIVLSPVTAYTQAPRLELDGGLAYQTAFPDRLSEGCGSGFGVVPSARLRYRANRLFAAEFGVSGHIQVKTEHQSGCGIALPPEGVRTIASFAVPRGSPSLTTEGRFVVTPIENAFGSLRALTGVAWFVGRDTPGWLVGTGLRTRTSWGAVVFDVEHWEIGVPYTLERVTFSPSGNTAEHMGDRRDWQSHWQLRLAFAVLSL